MRKIKLMADYDCFPIWETLEGGTKNIDPSSLPILESLQERLLTWADTYDSTLVRDDPTSSGFKSASDENDFEFEGLLLWKRLIQALDDEWVVAYFSQLNMKELQNPNEEQTF